jgi:hypothetical protein
MLRHLWLQSQNQLHLQWYRVATSPNLKDTTGLKEVDFLAGVETWKSHSKGAESNAVLCHSSTEAVERTIYRLRLLWKRFVSAAAHQISYARLLAAAVPYCGAFLQAVPISAIWV